MDQHYSAAHSGSDAAARNVTAVVTCVGRSGHLGQTLAQNAALVGRFIVATHPEDQATRNVVQACPAATLVLSDTCFAEDHAFNKGRMINAALSTAAQREWILLTDADVLLPKNLPGILDSRSLNRDVLYGARRREAIAPAGSEADIDTYPNGYFQLFHPRAAALAGRWPSVMCEAFCSAGGVDSWFQQQFPPDSRIKILDLSVEHLTHLATEACDWNGPLRSKQWRQFGILTPQGLDLVEALPPATVGQRRIRLVDSLHGQAWEGIAVDGQQLPLDVVKFTPQGITWLGRPIGHHHIHCAYWRE